MDSSDSSSRASSDSSFLDRLDKVVGEGEDDVNKGKKLFKEDKKRDREKANEPSKVEGKLKFDSKNSARLVLDDLPPLTREALMAMPADRMQACLSAYLEEHVNLLQNDLHRAFVRGQKTECDKLVRLQAFMSMQGLHFKSQCVFF